MLSTPSSLLNLSKEQIKYLDKFTGRNLELFYNVVIIRIYG